MKDPLVINSIRAYYLTSPLNHSTHNSHYTEALTQLYTPHTHVRLIYVTEWKRCVKSNTLIVSVRNLPAVTFPPTEEWRITDRWFMWDEIFLFTIDVREISANNKKNVKCKFTTPYFHFGGVISISTSRM